VKFGGMNQRLYRLLLIGLPLWALVAACYGFGLLTAANKWFPYPQILGAMGYATELLDAAQGKVTKPYVATREARTVILRRPGAMAPGFTLISGDGPKGSLFVKLVDADGKVQHAWDADWFRLWPDPSHLPSDVRPRSRPGTEVHGMLLSANGDLTFNYDALGLIQVDICGRPKWRLPQRTSHSLYRDEAGNFWTSDLEVSRRSDPAQPSLKAPFLDYRVIEVSPDGHVLKAIPLTELLIRNGYPGFLYMTANDQRDPGDTLHVNSVELFPAKLRSPYFNPGDVMVSFRNVDTIIVFDPKTLAIKMITSGQFVRQHDPHFLNGSTITVFNNNDVNAPKELGSTKVVAWSVKDRTSRVLFEGTPAHPFYTRQMGKQYTLPNGDLLLTEAEAGRALEVDPRGEVIWEYFNQVRPGVLGTLTDAQRIPPEFMSPARLKALAAACPHA
jgi:hypothetical protein